MSCPSQLPRRLLRVAGYWRCGADELRRKFRDQETDKLPFSVEASAQALEVCATRIEEEVKRELATNEQAETVNAS